eukprot:TRINITY_DN576_c0_g1_i1.p1 TRINITY_DN576_c0_g1~~TRINITY_DN576_c0_g1_i1.p1  ORF type:complete len:146 (+),score=46.42 TRINITY_DN576_c0_g1_i1:102-539(+)
MADTETEETTTVEEVEATPAGGEVLDVLGALKQVLKNALVNDGLARGLHECAKALDRRQAHLCVLASNCTEATYVKLVEALCREHDIKLYRVPEAKQLGEWAGLCKIDKQGKPRKVVGCSVVVVKDFGQDSNALKILLDYFKNQK